MSESGELVAGVDVGGTKTLAVVVEAHDPRNVVAQVRRATQVGGAGAVLATVTDALVQVTAAARTTPGALAAVGVGVPGIVHPAGTVRHAVNLGIGEEPVDLLERLRRLVGDPVVVAKDVDLAALWAQELLATGDDVAYLSIGTGVAAGLVIRGEIHPGAVGASGEIGHLPVAPDGAVCECGQRGCLETMASGTAIARRWRAAGTGGDSGPAAGGPGAGRADGGPPAGAAGPRMDGGGGAAAGMPASNGGGAASDLFRAAAAGDEAAIALRDEVCGYLAAAVAVIGLTVDPAHVVLGGGVAEVGPSLVDGVREALRRRAGTSPLLSALALDQRVTLLPKGTPAGALGAALAARQLVRSNGTSSDGEGPAPDPPTMSQEPA